MINFDFRDIYITVSYFSLVFQMVEAEEEYTEQMEILVSCFLRPFKMAASSKKPPCSHEDVNSIFLNSETVLFLHQIFLKGLTSRMESWPTLVLGMFFIYIIYFKWIFLHRIAIFIIYTVSLCFIKIFIKHFNSGHILIFIFYISTFLIILILI